MKRTLLLSLYWLLPVATSAQDMPLAQILIDGEDWSVVAEGYTFTDAPAVDKSGRLYFSDVRQNKVYKLGDDGKPVVFAESEAISGLKFGPSGRLYGCSGKQGKVVFFDADGIAQTLVEGVKPNDLTISHREMIYLTETATSKVWLVNPFEKTSKVVDTGIPKPNGLVLWPDQGTLVVGDFAGKHLYALRVLPDGGLDSKDSYYTCQLKEGANDSKADGMTCDDIGRLYVTTEAGIQVFDPTGRLSGVIAKPQDKFLCNVAFGGPDFHSLYATCSDKVYVRRVQAKGLAPGQRIVVKSDGKIKS